MNVNYYKGGYEIKAIYDSLHCSYLLLEFGAVYVLNLDLLQQFEVYLDQEYNGNEPALYSWYNSLSTSEKRQVIHGDIGIQYEDLFPERN